MTSIKTLVKRIPLLGDAATWVYRLMSSRSRSFPGTVAYWEGRYAQGGHSGVGSSGRFAAFKAEIINRIVAERQVRSVLEFGCGDGSQLAHATYPRYLGFDVSETAVARCRDRFAADPTKQFGLVSQYRGETADLVLSLDVIYHLIEDQVFREYMARLFRASERLVIIYSSNSEDNRDNVATHVRHRRFTDWIDEHVSEWVLLEHVPNRFPYRGDYREGCFADFFVYEKGRSPARRD